MRFPSFPGTGRSLRSTLNRLRGVSAVRAVRWYGADSLDDAAASLALRGAQSLRQNGGGQGLLLGPDGALLQQAARQLRQRGFASRRATVEQLGTLAEDASQIGAVLCCETDARSMMRALRAVNAHPALRERPFEYVTGLEPERALFARHDEYDDRRFVSPLLLDEQHVYELYAESLEHFEQKCGLRDFLDLYQCLRQVLAGAVPGAICEFGSYQGHSGWLVARCLAALDPQRALYLFDMFEHFPDESIGVDRRWNATHTVDFAAVKARFQDLPNTTLVQGDITETLPAAGIDPIALAYVDCDSLRAIEFLTRQLWQEHIPRGGMMVFEDYGHPALLGCRAAVHDFFDARSDAFCYFSQFSGLYLALKTQ